MSYLFILVLFWVHAQTHVCGSSGKNLRLTRPSRWSTGLSCILWILMFIWTYECCGHPEQGPPTHLSIKHWAKPRDLNCSAYIAVWDACSFQMQTVPEVISGVKASYLSLSAVKMTLRSRRREANTRRSRRKLREENKHSKSTCSRRESDGRHNSITCRRREREIRLSLRYSQDETFTRHHYKKKQHISTPLPCSYSRF